MLEERKLESTDNPRVSAIIIFLDGEAFLAEAIESVIAQSFEDWELLLVDDGSGPAATAVAKAYAARYPKKIRYLEHPGHANLGAAAARNLGTRYARAEFVAFLDADDVWLPSKLAAHMAILDAHPEISMVSGTAIHWNSWSGGSDTIVPTGHRQDVVIYPPDATLAVYPLGTAPAPSPSDLVIRTDAVRRIGGFEEQFIKEKQLFEDQAFLSKVYLCSPIYFCSAPSFKYRQHSASCCAKFYNAGNHHQVRLYFLEWFEKYLEKSGKTDRRVTSSLCRALRYYRNPRLHYLLSVPAKILNRSRRLNARIGRLIWGQASRTFL